MQQPETQQAAHDATGSDEAEVRHFKIKNTFTSETVTAGACD